jgi:hypothetical protein
LKLYPEKAQSETLAALALSDKLEVGLIFIFRFTFEIRVGNYGDPQIVQQTNGRHGSETHYLFPAVLTFLKYSFFIHQICVPHVDSDRRREKFPRI